MNFLVNIDVDDLERLLGQLVVVDVVLGELEAGQLEEARPADAVGPLAQALVLDGVLRVDLDEMLHGVGDLGPARRVVREERDRELRELRLGPGVGHLAADPDRDTVGLGVVDYAL